MYYLRELIQSRKRRIIQLGCIIGIIVLLFAVDVIVKQIAVSVANNKAVIATNAANQAQATAQLATEKASEAKATALATSQDVAKKEADAKVAKKEAKIATIKIHG